MDGIPYCGTAPFPDDWLTRWNLDPILLVALIGAGFGALRRDDVGPPFWLGLAVVALLFVSPLCALSSALFSVRIVDHVLLTAVSAPLMVQGLRFAGRGSPLVWAAGHALLFWIWHAPQPYDLALSNDQTYWAMQTSLFVSAVGFWASLRNASAPYAIALLLIMMVQMGLLGALITFAGSPLYAPHWLTTQPWGLDPIEDQQLAGIIMWAPASAIYLGAALSRGWRMLSPARTAAA